MPEGSQVSSGLALWGELDDTAADGRGVVHAGVKGNSADQVQAAQLTKGREKLFLSQAAQDEQGPFYSLPDSVNSSQAGSLLPLEDMENLALIFRKSIRAGNVQFKIDESNKSVAEILLFAGQVEVSLHATDLSQRIIFRSKGKSHRFPFLGQGRRI